MTKKKAKIALVTGGSRGLGKDMALRLADTGFDVVLTYLNNAAGATQTAAAIRDKGQRAATLQLDVSETAAFADFSKELNETLKEEFGTHKLDALVNNAGIGLYASFANTSEAGFDQMVNIHLKAPFFLTQRLLPALNDGASIVNISSGLARFSMPGYAAYGAVKSAVDTLTRYQAKELGSRKIRVNSVAPGAIETDFGGGAIRDNPELNSMISSLTALGRAGLPDDIGGVVAFLCSDDARWVNAQRIEVSGGVFI